MKNSEEQKILAIIPAAGRGTRLGLDTPKILAPINENETIWTILYELLAPYSNKIHVVLSPSGEPLFQTHLSRVDTSKTSVSTSIQDEPLGMGDAIFGAYHFWRNYQTLLIIWGDQVNLSEQTIGQVVESCGKPKTIILPTTLMSPPYVQYDFVEARLADVRMKREGHVLDSVGKSDVGLFALSVDGLYECWNKFTEEKPLGEKTGEVNFLPFLPFLSNNFGWQVINLNVSDANEARGVNTAEDFEFAKRMRNSKGR